MPADRPAPPALKPASDPTLSAAEARGKQMLLYEPAGPLGGSFTCARCGAVALQPDLLLHAAGCRYAGSGLPITVW